MKRSFVTLPFFFALLFCLMLFVSGCRFLPSSDSGEEAPAPIAPRLGTDPAGPLVGSGTLTCNQTCADQAQCGTAADPSLGGLVVLLNTAEPALENHDLIVGNNLLPMEIRTHIERDVFREGGVPEPMRFYKVAVKGAGFDRGEAWVAGWCIQQP